MLLGPVELRFIRTTCMPPVAAPRMDGLYLGTSARSTDLAVALLLLQSYVVNRPPFCPILPFRFLERRDFHLPAESEQLVRQGNQSREDNAANFYYYYFRVVLYHHPPKPLPPLAPTTTQKTVKRPRFVVTRSLVTLYPGNRAS